MTNRENLAFALNVLKWRIAMGLIRLLQKPDTGVHLPQALITSLATTLTLVSKVMSKIHLERVPMAITAYFAQTALVDTDAPLSLNVPSVKAHQSYR